MSKLTETVFGLFGIAILAAAIWFTVVEGFVPALVFFLVSAMFLGWLAIIVEKVGNVLDKVFSPSR